MRYIFTKTDLITFGHLVDHSVEEGVVAAAVDSHPKRQNGFLTGCLINALKEYSEPTIEDLPRYSSSTRYFIYMPIP